METLTNSDSLPQGTRFILPDLEIRDDMDTWFFNELIPSLTEEGCALKEGAEKWQWVAAGEMTLSEASDKLKELGDEWILPSPLDTTAGALNGIRFKPNLTDISSPDRDWRETDSGYVSFRNRGGIKMWGFDMTTDTRLENAYPVYFVKKSQ